MQLLPKAPPSPTRKSIETLQAEALSHGLKRSLGPVGLMLLGVGNIVGAGAYVMIGTAAGSFAGPAVILSFLIAAVACGLTALCYAELASMIPVSGSAYTYCYASLGQSYAWFLGWLILLDYGLAGSTLAVGLSGYLVSLLSSFHLHIPMQLASATILRTPHSDLITIGPRVNLLAVGALAAATAVLIRGVSESSAINNILVAIKISILAIFVVAGLGALQPHNWTPFIPPNEGGFTFGWAGVARAASVLFFAFLGFETVSAAASEARNPQRDMPFGILGALLVCTIIYIAVAVVLTGLIPYRELAVSDAIAVAADRMGHPNLAILLKVGALVGISSVLLMNGYGQSRVAFAISRDGLLPRIFSRLHPRFQTPHIGITVLAAISAAGAALFPLSLLIDLVSLGTALSFSIVSASVMWLRSTRPDLARPFRVPLGGLQIGSVWIGIVPIAAIFMCWAMMAPVVVDIYQQAAGGDAFPALFICGYLAAGAAIYFGYGRRNAHVAAEVAVIDLLQAGGAHE